MTIVLLVIAFSILAILTEVALLKDDIRALKDILSVPRTPEIKRETEPNPKGWRHDTWRKEGK